MLQRGDQPIKINEDLLTFSVKPNNEGVHKALSSLSSTVSTNGRVLEHSIHQHHSLRMEMTSANERLQEELRNERASRLELENKLASLQSAVRALEGTSARKEAVQGLEQGITRRLQSLEERAATIEKGECKTLTTAIYNSCTATLTKRVNEVEEELSIRLDEASEAVQQQVSDLHDEHAVTLDATITTRLEKMHQDTEATLAVFEEGLTASQTALETRFDDAHQHMNTRLLRSKDELSSVMCTGFDRMAKWMGAGDHALDALFGVLCIDKGACVEMWNSMMRDGGSPRPLVSSLPLRLAATTSWVPHVDLTCEQQQEGSAEEGDEVVEPKQVSAEETRRLVEATMEQQQCDELREIVMRHTTPLSSKTPPTDRHPSEGAPNAMDTTSDPRVRFVSRTPHAVAMRAAMQREMSSRVEVLRSELQHDMVSELLELQREIKGKVTSTKLGEMLTQYRDHQLYSTVKLLGADIQEVKANKLDTHSFYEAVKGKADTRALDSKVGYIEMEAQLSAMGDSTERLMRDLSKAHERLRHAEIGLRNLQTYVVSGGGVYATKQALDSKLGELSPLAVVLHPTTPNKGNADSSPISTRSRETREALNVSVDAASVLNNSAAASALKFQVAQEREVQQRVRQRGASLHKSPEQHLAYNPQAAALLTGADAYNSALVGDENAVLATAMRATRANKAEQLADTLMMERGPESIEAYLLPEEAVPDQTLLHSGFVPDSETCLRDSTEWQLASRQAADQLVRPPTAPKVPPRAGSASQGKRAPLPSQTRHAASASSTTPVNLHIGGFPSSRPSSASVVAVPTPTVPLTRSQVDYCDQLGLDRAATGKVLQQARPAELAKEVKQTAPKRLPITPRL